MKKTACPRDHPIYSLNTHQTGKKKKKRTEGKVRIIIKIPKLKAVILPNKNKNAQRPRLRFCLIANEENGSKKVFFPS